MKVEDLSNEILALIVNSIRKHPDYIDAEGAKLEVEDGPTIELTLDTANRAEKEFAKRKLKIDVPRVQ